MTARESILRAMRAAGAENDKQRFTRLYVENRISLTAANAEWQAGRKFAAFIAARDAQKDQRP
jgi:hypothetical protein